MKIDRPGRLLQSFFKQEVMKNWRHENLLVFYIVDGLKGNLIICFNFLMLLCKHHVNIHAALT